MKKLSKIFKVYVNRVTLVFAVGTFIMGLMLVCNPYINVFLLFAAMFVFMSGGAYVSEEMKQTAGERLCLRKFYNLLDF